jgi:hypothetical protein
MKSSSSIALFLLGVLLVSTPASALQVTLNPVAFNTMYAEDPTRASGQSTSLFLGPIADGSPRRILLRFDPTSLPPTAVVTRARLNMVVNRAAIASASSDSIAVHRVLASWGQGTAIGPGGGGGTQASAGDATWTARLFNTPPAIPSLLWTSPGGDFNPVPSRAGTMGVSIGTIVVDSTSGMVADIESWRSNPAGNHGWIVIGPEGEAFSQKARRVVGVTLTVDYELRSAAVPGFGPVSLLIALFALAGLGYRLHARRQAPA